MAYYGKDGKIYDTWGQQHEADARYEQHEEQKQLLAAQNQLLAKQMEMSLELERKRNLQAELEEAKREKLQLEQMQHDEKMRILKLFDNIGLSKDTFDDFLRYLLPNANLVQVISQENSKKLEFEEELKKIKSLKDEKDEYEYVKQSLPVDLINSAEQAKEMFEKYLENPNDSIMQNMIIGYFDEKPNEEYKIYKKNKNKGIINGFIFIVLEFLFMFILISMELVVSGVIVAIICCVLMIYNFCKKGDLTPAVNKELSTINTIINSYKNPDNIKEIILMKKNEIQESIKNTDENIKNMQKDIKDVSKRWNDFIEFRKNHYNSNMEKLLIDVGLKDTILNLGLDYPKINSNNKINNGTIEDYITYFDELGN